MVVFPFRVMKPLVWRDHSRRILWRGLAEVLRRRMMIAAGVELGVRFDEAADRGTDDVGGARSVMIVSLPDARSVNSKNKQGLTMR